MAQADYSLLQPTVKLNSPFESLGQVLEMRQRQQQISSNQALEEDRRQRLADEQKKQRQLDAYYQKLSAPGSTEDRLEAIRTDPDTTQFYANALKSKQETDKSAADVQHLIEETNKMHAETATALQAHQAGVAQQVIASGNNPAIFIAHATREMELFPALRSLIAPAIAQVQAAPLEQRVGLVTSIMDGWGHSTPASSNAMTTAATAAAELPGKVAAAQQQQQVTAGMQGGPLTAEQRAANALGQGNLAVARQREAREAATAKANQSDVTTLTPEGLDAAATMFAKTGQLPALGMGDKTTRKQIINRAAAMIPGLDVASAKADYDANRKSLDNIAGTLDTLESFSKAAGKNLDQFVALAQKLPDTGIPWANTPLRMLNEKMVGAEYMPAIRAAQAVATREVARITGDPKLKGVLSDAARKEVADLVPADITLAQLRRVVPVLLTDMANVHSSLSEQKDAIAGRIKLGAQTPGPVATKAPATVSRNVNVTAPDGSVHTFDTQAQADVFKKLAGIK